MPATAQAVEMLQIAARAADAKGGEDLIALDVSGPLPLVDIFLLVTGRNERNVGAIADEIEEKLLRPRPRQPQARALLRDGVPRRRIAGPGCCPSPLIPAGARAWLFAHASRSHGRAEPGEPPAVLLSSNASSESTPGLVAPAFGPPGWTCPAQPGETATPGLIAQPGVAAAGSRIRLVRPSRVVI